ncbi:hypothetical protein [Muricauda sp. MAR_2010_75]|uniref:hypothetical protein n=1 Tax=Allomuricauda sp. MAR_2010_75 TaxID=1250232 RepID=UPI000563BDBB|nr:hypothetical protein [Muricauda sp. MAR_2010_75]
MKFNWVISGENDQAVKKACIDMEYRLRPKITKFLLKKLDGDFSGDFSCFHFDVDMKNHWVWISNKTPQRFIEKIKADFDQEINGGSTLFSVA